MTNFVPISLVVQMELTKFWQAMFMQWEADMYDVRKGLSDDPYNREEDMAMQASSSNLVEELGCVEYVFSDKTGTLTCNIMEFRKFTAGEVAYGTDETDPHKEQEKNVNFYDPNLEKVLQGSGKNKEDLENFLISLALCHTIVIDQENKDYSAESPDELALVRFAKQVGYEFIDTDHNDNMKIKLPNGQEKIYKKLQECKFTSTRKRMSIVIQDMETKQIKLISKGADSIIYERLTQDCIHS